tara:strand:+ start:122 stop:247 length:126 start_codon:yes stop_codon:yes gene_type:complete
MNKGKPLIHQKDRTRMLHEARNGLDTPFFNHVEMADFRRLY